MFKKIRAYWRLFWLVSSLATYVLSYLVKIKFVKHTTEAGYRLRRKWVKFALWILNIKIEQKGKSDYQNVLFVSNHRNLIDPVIVARYVDACFISKAEVERYPFLGKGAILTGVIYVKRDEKDSRHATRRLIGKTLEAGENVVIFPEGTTGIERTTKHFYKGSFYEAARLNIPVVPIAIEYQTEDELWKQPSLLKQFVQQFGKRNINCKIKILDPIQSKDSDFLLQKSKQLIDKEILKMQNGWSEVWDRGKG